MYDYLNISNKINKAKIIITIPETLFNVFREKLFIFDLIHPTPKLKVSHHRAEPKKTPTTKRDADLRLPVKKPVPVNTAIKEIIVIGFVIVRKTVER